MVVKSQKAYKEAMVSRAVSLEVVRFNSYQPSATRGRTFWRQAKAKSGAKQQANKQCKRLERQCGCAKLVTSASDGAWRKHVLQSLHACLLYATKGAAGLASWGSEPSCNARCVSPNRRLFCTDLKSNISATQANATEPEMLDLKFELLNKRRDIG